MAYTRVTTKVELIGPFFTSDITKTIAQNIQDMLEALSDEMAVTLQEQIAHLPLPRSTGWTVDHTVGYRISSKTGQKWRYWAAAGAYTYGMNDTDAIHTKAAAASIERRFHPYRRVKSAVSRSRAIRSADLAKGIR